MQWVSKAVQYYKDINPATLTGAIDVIVVERKNDQVPGQVELACSPFHVRFGKLSVLRPIDKKVRISVNEERVPFYMKVGETGEAFFVFETESDVPEDLQTSPLSGPVSDDGQGEDQGEMEPLDLDAPALNSTTTTTGGSSIAEEADEDQPLSPNTSHPSSPPTSTSSRYASLSSGTGNNQLRTIPQLANLSPQPSSTNLRSLNHHNQEEDNNVNEEESSSGSGSGGPSMITKVFEKASGMLPMTQVADRVGNQLRDQKLKHDIKKDVGVTASGGLSKPLGGGGNGKKEEEDPKGRKAEFGKMDERIEKDLAGMSLNDKDKDQDREEEGATRTTSTRADSVIDDDARGKNSDVETLLNGSSYNNNGNTTTSTTSEHQVDKVTGKVLRNAAGEEVGVAPENTGALMLDMSGYKVHKEKEEERKGGRDHQDDEEAEGGRRKLQREFSSNGIIDSKAEKEIISFTQALLQSTDPTTLANFFDPASEVDIDEEEEATLFDNSVPPFYLEGATAVEPSVIPPSEQGKLAAARGNRRSRHSSRASSPPPRPVSISSLQSLHAESSSAPHDDEAEDDDKDGVSPYEFSLKVNGKKHVFELSLCGSEGLLDQPDEVIDQLFKRDQLSFNQFMEQTSSRDGHDDLCENPDLVVKYCSRYLTWDNASPVLASLSVYRKSLVNHPEHHHRMTSLPKEEKQEQEQQRSRGWSLWWGRNRTSAISPPDSPKSEPIDDTTTTTADSLSPRRRLLSQEPVPPPPPPPRNEDDFPPEDHTKHYAKTLRLTSDQLKALKLNKGINTISFSVRSSYSGYATCTSRIFLWESDYKVVISDIDGTITKSDALGHVFTMIGRDWTHLGVAKLYTDISRNGYKMMYLTSRAIGQADTTREYLKGIQQNGFKLPPGPVIMSPDRLMTSLHREVIMRKPEVFKMACLRDIQRLFGSTTSTFCCSNQTPFYAGFGNRITDALSYRSVDIPSSRIFTIDSNGEVKMELLELAGYKSSYIHMTDLVDQMFPPIKEEFGGSNEPEFTDFNFWRQPLPEIELPLDLLPPTTTISSTSSTPVSPTLSARSDQSVSRIGFPSRLGNLANSLSRRSSRSALSEPNVKGGINTPSSPLLAASVAEEPIDFEEEEESNFRRHQRSSSMPGSLPDNEGDFERYYNNNNNNESKVSPASSSTTKTKKKTTSEAEAYKKKVKGQLGDDGDDDEEEEEEEEEEEHDEDLYEGERAEEEEVEGDDFGDQLDFSSVPYL